MHTSERLTPSVISRTKTVYLAMSGVSVIDEGYDLETFVASLLAAWELEDEHIVVLATDADGARGPRLVAVLYPGAGGKTLVKWWN